jgi:hypothetical protein
LRRGQQGGSSASWHAAAIAPSSDLPDGQFCDFAVQPLPQKYFAFSEAKISCSFPAVPPPQEGRIAIVTDVGCGMRWTLWCRETSALMRTAKSCGPDAPTLALRFAGLAPRNDGGKRARSPGRARNKPLKPLRREGRMFPANLWFLTRVLSTMHTRPRVRWAPSLPCAL